MENEQTIKRLKAQIEACDLRIANSRTRVERRLYRERMSMLLGKFSAACSK